MLPPSNSLLHQSHKEAEVLAELRGQLAAALSSPPPPYSSTVSRPPIHNRDPAPENQEESWSDLDDVDVDSDDETYNSTWAEPKSGPITVDIDASFYITGHGNTVIRPSVVGGSGIGSLNQTTLTGTPVEGKTTGRPACVSSSLSAAALLQSVQNQRQAGLAELATSLIPNLRDFNVLTTRELDASDTSRPSAPASTSSMHVKINTGVRIEGSRNVFYGGPAGRMVSRANNAAATSNNTSQATCHNYEGIARKRRAQSVCIDLGSRSRSLQELTSTTISRNPQTCRRPKEFLLTEGC